MDKGINDRLKTIRKALKLSQEKFAKRISLKQGSLSDIERGRIGVSNKVAEAVSESFKVNIGWLYTGTGEMFIGKNYNLQGQNTGYNTGSLDKIFEKQKIVAEKYFNNLSSDNPEFDELRKAIMVIQSFENLIDNIISSPQLNAVVKIEDSARKYLDSSYSQFKVSVDGDFKKLVKNKRIFTNLAKAMILFANQLREQPEGTIDIDKEEAKSFLDLNI